VRETKLYREANLESVLCAVILWLSVGLRSEAMAGRPEDPVCDAGEDYSLGIEDQTSLAGMRHIAESENNEISGGK
jgi:hypothetical protein